MCGIIGAASSRSVGKILVNGLKKMEYRGYDSAGLVLNQDEAIQLKTLGKVANLEDANDRKKTQSPFWHSAHKMGYTRNSIGKKCSPARIKWNHLYCSQWNN